MTDENIRIQKLLSDIHKSAKRVLDRLQGVTKDSFCSDASIDLQDIVVRRLTIVGEASSALLRKHPKFSKQNPNIPLHQARGLRNVIVHDYDGINWFLIWDTVQEDLPKLVEAIEPLLSDDEK